MTSLSLPAHSIPLPSRIGRPRRLRIFVSLCLLLVSLCLPARLSLPACFVPLGRVPVGVPPFSPSSSSRRPSLLSDEFQPHAISLPALYRSVTPLHPLSSSPYRMRVFLPFSVHPSPASIPSLQRVPVVRHLPSRPLLFHLPLHPLSSSPYRRRIFLPLSVHPSPTSVPFSPTSSSRTPSPFPPATAPSPRSIPSLPLPIAGTSSSLGPSIHPRRPSLLSDEFQRRGVFPHA